MSPPFHWSLLVPIQNRSLPDAEGTAGVGPLTPGVPQALAGLAPHQHRGDVVDLISRLSTGTLLGLGDAAALAPAPAGVEDQDEAQDGQQKGDHPALRGGGWHLEQRQKQKGRKEREKEQRKKRESKGRTDPENLAKSNMDQSQSCNANGTFIKQKKVRDAI